jgi:curved DNA-binding protein CbpA
VTVLPLHPTHYDRLGLAEDASLDAVRQAVAALAAQAPVERQLAAAVLSDPLRRAVYDRYLARERAVLAAQQRRLGWRRRLPPPWLGGGLLIGATLWLFWTVWPR